MNAPPKTPPAPAPVDSGVSRPRVDSNQLLLGAPAVEIQHGGQTYLLRVTRENKLILTK